MYLFHLNIHYEMHHSLVTFNRVKHKIYFVSDAVDKQVGVIENHQP